MMKLRPYEDKDASVINSWFKDEFSFRQWSANIYGTYPISPQDIIDNYARHESNGNFCALMAFDENGIVGHLIMRFIDVERTVLRLGFVVVDPERRGQGLGKAMISLTLRYAFERLKVQKVNLGVFSNNEPAYRCYKSVGFREKVPPQEKFYTIMNDFWKDIELEYVPDKKEDK